MQNAASNLNLPPADRMTHPLDFSEPTTAVTTGQTVSCAALATLVGNRT
jgi:hypothetical protein